MKKVLIQKNGTYHIVNENDIKVNKKTDYHYSKRCGETFKVFCDIKDFNCEDCKYFGNCKFQEK